MDLLDEILYFSIGWCGMLGVVSLEDCLDGILHSLIDDKLREFCLGGLGRVAHGSSELGPIGRR